MEDLACLNRNLAKTALGALNDAQASYLDFYPRCIGRLRQNVLEHSTPSTGSQNTLGIFSINKEFLFYLRLLAKDVVAGDYHRLLETSLDVGQVTILARMGNADIVRIAETFKGCVADIDTSFVTHAQLSRGALRFHAVAAITAATD